MAGYSPDFSKSNNALDAEANGRFPASVVAKRLGVPVAAVKAAEWSEWHHTSSWYNRTYYYDLEEVRGWLATDEGQQALANARAPREAVTYQDVTVEWLEWSGSRKHPKATERTAGGCTVTIKGQMATITLPDGGTMRKRLTTRGLHMRTPGARFEEGEGLHVANY